MKNSHLHLLLAIAICAGFAILGTLFTGDALETWFQAIHHPWYSLPLWGWYIVGVLYYIMAIAILYRLLNQPPDNNRTIALGLTLAMIAGNEVWNFLFFGLESTLGGFVGLIPFTVLVYYLFYQLFTYNRPTAWILFPYLLWLVYDLLWTYGLWTLNS